MKATWRLTVHALSLQVVTHPGQLPMIIQGEGTPPTLEILTEPTPAETPTETAPPA
jgi:hypothetical protein